MAIATINFPEPLERFYYFADDQVLTAGQLNQLAGHFDLENRLTRTKGLGIGIVCGLEVELAGGEIVLSKGAAITSTGDMLHFVENQRFTHFRKLQDEASVPTEDGTIRVLKLGSETTTVPMWRLQTTAVQDSVSLANPVGLPGLENLAVVLFLDSWLKSPEECTDTNCDNGGVTQVNDLMVMLVPKQHLQPAENSPNRRRNLPKANVRNVDLAGGTLTNEQELINRYEAALGSSLESLSLALGQISARFPSLVETAFGNANPVGQWPVQLRNFSTGSNNTPKIQYVYDFFRDLASSINELWEAIIDIPGECCPVANKYQKYVMAGELVRGTGVRFAEYRNYFIESPILNEGTRRSAKAVFLLRRIGLMMRSFSPSPVTEGIRISPSKKAGAKLGDRAIPFYYQLTDVTPLHEFWSFEKSQLGMEDTNHGYFMREISSQDEVKNPFNYTTDGSDFYQVEGLIGMGIKEAEAEVEKLQLLHNLGFKIETIQIEDDLPKVKPFKPIKFPDLNLFFQHYRDDLHSNMHLADHYIGSLKNAFDASDKVGFDDAKDPDGTDVKTNLTSAVETDRLSFSSKVNLVTTRMYKPLKEFHADFTNFRVDYDEAASIGESIDRKVTYAKQSVVSSPIQKLVLDNSFKRFDSVVESFKRRTDFVLRQFIFDKFFNQNPGLRHQCGVPDGGTLVLAYSAVTQKVVADFALSYCCVVEVHDDEDHAPPPPITVKPLPGIIVHPILPRPPFKWLDKLDLFAVPRIPKDVFSLKDVVKLPDLEGLVRTRVQDYVKTQDFTSAISGNFVQKAELANYATIAYTDNTARNQATTVFLDNITRFNVGGGKSGLVGGATDFNGIADLGLRRDAEILDNSAKRLMIFEGLQENEKTPEIKAEMEGLRKQISDKSASLVEKAGASQGGITSGTDAHTVLNVVSTVAENLKSTVDFAPVATIVETQVGASVAANDFARANTFNNLKNIFRRQ